MAAMSGSTNPCLERAFAQVPREAFLGPGPWMMSPGSWSTGARNQYIVTPSSDPIYLYQNALFAIAADKGINNGQPSLHAQWLGIADPQAGEAVTHIGAGTGYYSAILAMLVLPDGKVRAFEIDKELAALAKHNLQPYENVEIVNRNATRGPLPLSDIIYVNAGVTAPPACWLEALNPGGRLIFPWRPGPDIGLALLVTRVDRGYSVKPLSPSWFIACIGASDTVSCHLVPNKAQAGQIRSAHLAKHRAPEDTALAIYEDIWFSSSSVDD